jgi:4,5-epoxidase
VNLIVLGSQYDEHFSLADVHIDWDLSHSSANAFVSADYLLAAFPLPKSGDNYYRIVLDNFQQLSHHPSSQIPDEIQHGLGSTELPPSLEVIQQVFDSVKPNVKLSNLGWISAFRISHRLADSYQASRVFLAGVSCWCVQIEKCRMLLTSTLLLEVWV